MHSFLYTPAQIDAPCRLEAHYARNKKLKKCAFCIAQHHLLQSMNMFLHVLCTMRRTLHSKLLISIRAWMCIYTYMYKGNVQQKNPFCAAPCITKNISPRFSPTRTPCTAVGFARKTLCSKEFMGRAWKTIIYTYMYNRNIQQSPLCVESWVTKELPYLIPLASVFPSRCNYTVWLTWRSTEYNDPRIGHTPFRNGSNNYRI